MDLTPLLPCRTRSFEHVLLHVELVCLLSASSKGVPATVRTHPVIVLITVQGLLRITNSAGKTGYYTKIKFCSINRPFRTGTQEIFLKIFFVFAKKEFAFPLPVKFRDAGAFEARFARRGGKPAGLPYRSRAVTKCPFVYFGRRFDSCSTSDRRSATSCCNFAFSASSFCELASAPAYFSSSF